MPDRSGVVAAAAGTRVSAVALESALRADAVRLWALADAAALQVAIEPVTWSDGSLGCPRPGVAYTQALVPGYRVVVRERPGPDAREVVYHATDRGYWVLCPPGRRAMPLPGATAR